MKKILYLVLITMSISRSYSQTLDETSTYIIKKYPEFINRYVGENGEIKIEIDEYGNVTETEIHDFKTKLIITQSFNVNDVTFTKVTDNNSIQLKIKCNNSVDCIKFISKDDIKVIKEKQWDTYFISFNTVIQLEKIFKAFNHLKKVAKKEPF